MTEVDTVSERREADARFGRFLDALRKRVSKQQFATWFQRMSLVRWAGGELVIGLPNRFYQEWFHKHFRSLLLTAAQQVEDTPLQLAFAVGQGADHDPAPPPPPPAPPPSPEPTTAADPAPAQASPLLRLHRHYTFANFIVGPSNRIAYASAQATAQDPGRAYNPLFVHGSVGLGKTHLLHAVCHEFLRRRAGERVLFLSCEEFTNAFVQALQRHDLEQFRERFRNVHLLVIDDIHFLKDKERIQDEFFHTFNRLYQLQRQIVVSSDALPSDIPTLQERLVSRFKWGLVVKIDQPEVETRMAIVRRKAELLGIAMPAEVAEFIASNFRSNIRELEGALLSVSARADVLKVPIDLALAQEALESSLQEARPVLTIDRILEAVASHYHVKPSDLRSGRRNRSISLPRQVVMFLTREATDLSLGEIGDHFGGRDHSTVLYAIRKVKEQVERDPRLRADVERLRDRLGTQ